MGTRDTAQTLYLSANYKIFEIEARKVNPGADSISNSVSYVQYPSLAASGDVYKTFIEHVDSVFSQAVADCFGMFVLLTEPIISQQAINRLVALFKAKFQDQYWAIASLLNYTVHMKKCRSEHLLPFYNRMIFYRFMSISRV
jgi:hypothetical protein